MHKSLLQHLSPLGWEHINLTGDHLWAAAESEDRKREIQAVATVSTGFNVLYIPFSEATPEGTLSLLILGTNTRSRKGRTLSPLCQGLRPTNWRARFSDGQHVSRTLLRLSQQTRRMPPDSCYSPALRHPCESVASRNPVRETAPSMTRRVC